MRRSSWTVTSRGSRGATGGLGELWARVMAGAMRQARTTRAWAIMMGSGCSAAGGRPDSARGTGLSTLRHSAAVDDAETSAMDRPAPASVFPGQLAWENEGTSRIPFASYTSEALHR